MVVNTVEPGGVVTSQHVKTWQDHIDFETCAGTSYTSWDYHQHPSGSGKPKGIWSVTEQDEADIFCLTESSGWSSKDGDLWYVSEMAKLTIGTRGEKLAKFEKPPANPQASWHGYPVSNNSSIVSKHMIRDVPAAVLREWVKQGRITKCTMLQIAKRLHK